MALGPVPNQMIETAIGSPSTEQRALAAQAIGRMVRDLPLSDAERRLSSQIFEVLSRDVAEEVRRALAVTLRLSDNLPPAIANRLINDIDSIAVPILASSPSVSDDALITILRSRAGVKTQAIATRHRLSKKVSQAVITFGDSQAVLALAANDTALISKEDAARLVKLAEDDDLIRDAALRRQDMPQDLAVALIHQHVQHIDENLAPETDDHNRIAQETGQRAQAHWSSADWSPDAVKAYVDALVSQDRLDEATIARAAGQGDWRFVQLALAKLAGISSAKAGMIVLDTRTFGLNALLQRSGLGAAARELVVASAGAFRDIERSGAYVSRDRFQRLMSERVASHPAATDYGDIWMNWLDDGLGPQAI